MMNVLTGTTSSRQASAHGHTPRNTPLTCFTRWASSQDSNQSFACEDIYVQILFWITLSYVWRSDVMDCNQQSFSAYEGRCIFLWLYKWNQKLFKNNGHNGLWLNKVRLLGCQSNMNSQLRQKKKAKHILDAKAILQNPQQGVFAF